MESKRLPQVWAVFVVMALFVAWGGVFTQLAHAAFILEPRVFVTTATTGTGALALGSAQTGYRTFTAVMANGDTIWYTVYNTANTAEWEQGIGTWNTGNTLTRTTVLSSSNAGAAVNFSAGTKNVFSDLPPKVLNFSGDGTLSSAGALTITKTSGVSFGYFATGTDAANLTGTLAAGRLPALSGDVTSSAGSAATTLANIPTATPAAGSILFTNIAAPSTPASGKTSVYVDSTQKVLSSKNDAGTVSITVVPDTGAANNYLSAISAAGVITKSQPSCSSLSNGATGCSTTVGTAATANTGTSGATLPFLNGTNTWSGVQSFNSSDLVLKGASSGTITLNAAAAAGSNTVTLPAGTTDFSATGGASQVVKQTSSGGALTVARLACSDLSDSTLCAATSPLAVASGGTALASGTSGGVLAYTASGTLASSGALTANLPVIGGGAGAVPTVGTRSGNTTAYVTTTGTQTNGDCVKIDANGNHVASGGSCGSIDNFSRAVTTMINFGGL